MRSAVSARPARYGGEALSPIHAPWPSNTNAFRRGRGPSFGLPTALSTKRSPKPAFKRGGARKLGRFIDGDREPLWQASTLMWASNRSSSNAQRRRRFVGRSVGTTRFAALTAAVRFGFADFFTEYLAEREGFEPSIRLPVFRFSRPARSTTPPPLRGLWCGADLVQAVGQGKRLLSALPSRHFSPFRSSAGRCRRPRLYQRRAPARLRSATNSAGRQLSGQCRKAPRRRRAASRRRRQSWSG